MGLPHSPSRASVVRVRRRYPINAVFVVYCAVTLLVAIGAFNASNNLLFWLFGLSLGMLLVSGVLSGVMMMSLHVVREPLATARVDQALRVRYRITNRSRWLPAFGLHLRERTGLSIHSGKAGTLNAAPAGSVAHVPARTTVVAEAVCTPTQRGRLCLTGFDLTTTFPFGFIRKSLSFDDPADMIIQPRHEPHAQALLDANKGLLGTGYSAQRAGRVGDEPIGIREYVRGDPANLVAWKASARRPRGDLVVRQNAEGVARRLWVVLRLSASSPHHETERAIATAATIVRSAAERRFRVGLSVRADWSVDTRSHGLGIDTPPGVGPEIIINDLSILTVPAGGALVPAEPPGDPRLAGADVVIDVAPNGTASQRQTTRHGGAA